MPLDTSTTYPLTRLRLDGRRWNETRQIRCNINTSPSSSGSSFFSMGNTSVLCTVHGPAQEERGGRAEGAGGGANGASVEVELNIAGFSGVDRKRVGRNDKRATELSQSLQSLFSSHLHLQSYPYSTITLHLHILSQDGSLLASCINASTLALIDAGIPMPGYLAAITAGISSSFNDISGPSSSSTSEGKETPPDPLLDLSGQEELEVPFLTLATTGIAKGDVTAHDDEAGNISSTKKDESDDDLERDIDELMAEAKGQEDTVSLVLLETRAHLQHLRPMMAVGHDGCRDIRKEMRLAVKAHGKRILRADRNAAGGGKDVSMLDDE